MDGTAVVLDGVAGIGRALAVGVGSTLIASTFLLYETEERRLRSRLEDAWVRIDDASRLAHSRRLAFVRELGRIVEDWFGRVYGEFVVSLRTVILAAFLSVAPIVVFAHTNLALAALPAIAQALNPLTAAGTVTRSEAVLTVVVSTLILVGWPVAFVWVAWRVVVPRTARSDVAITGRALRAGSRAAAIPWAPLTMLVLYVASQVWDARLVRSSWISDAVVASNPEQGAFYRQLRSPISVAGQMFGLIAGGVAGDLLLLRALRIAARYTAGVRTSAGAAVAIVLATGFGVLTFGVPIWVSGGYFATEGATPRFFLWSSAGLANLADACIATVFVLVASVLLLHRATWPLLNRLVYAASQHAVLSSTRARWVAGVALLMLGVTSPSTVQQWLLEVIK